MITQENGDGSTWEATVEMREDGDGTAGFWQETARKLLNRTAHLYALTLDASTGFIAKLASQSTGSFGTGLVGQRAITDSNQGNLASGPLSAAIQSLWQGKAGLAASNIFTGPQRRSGSAAIAPMRGSTTIPPASTSNVIHCGADHWEFEPTAGASTIPILVSALSPYVPLNGTVITVTVLTLLAGRYVRFVRDDGSELVRNAANGFMFTASFRWDGTKFRMLSTGGDIAPDFNTGPATP